jgi:hypothetical protein
MKRLLPGFEGSDHCFGACSFRTDKEENGDCSTGSPVRDYKSELLKDPDRPRIGKLRSIGNQSDGVRSDELLLNIRSDP